MPSPKPKLLSARALLVLELDARRNKETTYLPSHNFHVGNNRTDCCWLLCPHWIFGSSSLCGRWLAVCAAALVRCLVVLIERASERVRARESDTAHQHPRVVCMSPVIHVLGGVGVVGTRYLPTYLLYLPCTCTCACAALPPAPAASSWVRVFCVCVCVLLVVVVCGRWLAVCAAALVRCW